jgi:hypothetical protein
MKYESFFREIIAPMRARWMSDADYEEFVQIMIAREGAAMDIAIDQGVANGYSVEQQLEIVRKNSPYATQTDSATRMV